MKVTRVTLMLTLVLLLTAGTERLRAQVMEEAAPETQTEELIPVSIPALEYRLLATRRTSTMEKEVNEAAREGFRIDNALPSYHEEMLVIMSRPVEATPSYRYEYKVLATIKSGTMEKEIQKAARDGFHPRAHARYGDEAVFYVERDREVDAKPSEYRILRTKKIPELEKELIEATEEGFQPMAQTTFKGTFVWSNEYAIILRRPPELVPASIPVLEYRLLNTSEISTMEEQVNEAAREGFRIDNVPPVGGDMPVIMSRPVEATPSHRYEYRVFSTVASEIAGAFEEATKEGFHPRAHTMLSEEATVFYLERDREAEIEPFEYRMLWHTRIPALEKELVEAAKEDFQVVALTIIGRSVGLRLLLEQYGGYVDPARDPRGKVIILRRSDSPERFQEMAIEGFGDEN